MGWGQWGTNPHWRRSRLFYSCRHQVESPIGRRYNIPWTPLCRYCSAMISWYCFHACLGAETADTFGERITNNFRRSETDRPAMWKLFEVCSKRLERVAGTLTIATMLGTLWLIVFTLSKGSLNVNNETLGMMLLLSTSLGAGLLVKVLQLPSLLGMMLIGLVWKNWNVTSIDITSLISITWSSILRY